MKKLLFNVPMIVCIFSVMNVTAQPCSDCESNCTTGAVATGQCSFAACDGSRSNGLRSAALVGGYAKWTSSFSVGSSTVAHSDKSFAIGSKSEAWAPMSFTLGHKLRVDTMAFNSMVIGVGSDVLVNDIANSIMLGMNSTLSTIFVEGSSGDGTWGNVGIGNITAPASLLHVRDQIRVGLTASGGDAGAAGSLVFNNAASNTITFNTPASMSTQSYTLPTAQGANNTVLTTDASGNLSWAAPGTISNAWLTTGNTGTNATSNFLGTIDNVDLVFRTFNTEKVRVMAGGNVGIGTAAPAGKLHVNSASGNTDLVISKPDASSGRLVFHNITTETANIRLDANEDLIVEHDQSN
ncbi:MAG: hypothetical protein K9J06_02325, partial [Flavobacteriales bacterium]|nr:hypothetical protein [Flavobacteriales bacterium]